MTEESLFAAAVEMPPPQRKAFLDQACQGQPALRAQLEELLSAHDNPDSFFDHSPAGEGTVEATKDGDETQKSARWSGSLAFLAPCDKPGRIGRLGPYEIIEVVGHGGMGVVLRAFDTKLSRIVAVKVLAPELAANPTAVKRFLREASSAAAVVHDHVVTIHAVEDGSSPPYLVMEFVQGQTLQQKIERQGALELKHILRIGSQAAAGLAAAHKQGLIHRDVKPGNILLENGVERVKITDFGLARAVDDLEMTQTGLIAGTPQYMSPEQAQAEPIDCRSDLFSLGSVLYAMCTGRPPFRAESTVGILRRVCDDTPRPMSEVNQEIPSWLEAIVAKLLAKNPADRFQTAAEVADLLSRHLAHVQNPSSVSRPETVQVPPAVRPKQRGDTALIVTIVAISLVILVMAASPVVAVMAYWLWSHDAPQKQNVEIGEPVPYVSKAPTVRAPLPEGARTIRGWGSSWSSDSKFLVLSPSRVKATPTERLDLFNAADLSYVKSLEVGKDPCWSPVAGGPIAYVEQSAKAASVWVVQADGSNPRRISDGYYVCGWSPDGTRVYDHDIGSRMIRAIEWNRSEPTWEELITLPSDSGSYPCVSPDGKLVAYGVSGSQTRLEVREITGDKLAATMALPEWNGLLCGWSPDSKQVLYGDFGVGGNVGLWSLDVPSGEAKKLLEGPYTLPRWSPDGKWISVDDRLRGEVLILPARIAGETAHAPGSH